MSGRNIYLPEQILKHIGENRERGESAGDTLSRLLALPTKDRFEYSPNPTGGPGRPPSYILPDFPNVADKLVIPHDQVKSEGVIKRALRRAEDERGHTYWGPTWTSEGWLITRME